MAKRERRDSQQDKDRTLDYAELEADEPERESIAALKGILTKIAAIVKPLGLSPEEACNLVQEMYERVLELDSRLVGESEQARKRVLTAYIAETEITREDDRIVAQYPAAPFAETLAQAEESSEVTETSEEMPPEGDASTPEEHAGTPEGDAGSEMQQPGDAADHAGAPSPADQQIAEPSPTADEESLSPQDSVEPQGS